MMACGLCMAAAAMLPGPTCLAAGKYCAVTRVGPSPTMLGGRLVTRVRRFFGKDQDQSEAAFKVSVAQASEEVKALLDADFAQAAVRAGEAVADAAATAVRAAREAAEAAEAKAKAKDAML